MSRHIPDMPSRRRASASSPDSISNPNIVESAKPPTRIHDGEHAARKASKGAGRQLPIIPSAQLDQAPSLYSTHNETGAGRSLEIPSHERRRKAGSVAAMSATPQEIAQLHRDRGAGTVSVLGRAASNDLRDVGITEELETSSGYVTPNLESVKLSVQPNGTRRTPKKFSLPGGAPVIRNTGGTTSHRRPSYGSTFVVSPVRRTSKDVRKTSTRKTSTRKTSSIQYSHLKEQLLLRIDFHLQGLSLMQTRSTRLQRKCINFSRNYLNISVSLGGRVDTCAAFELKKVVRDTGQEDILDEDEYSASLTQPLSIPVTVGVPIDNPEKFLSKDIRVNVEYGQSDVLGSGKGGSRINWKNLASGSVDITTELTSTTKRFNRDLTIPLVVHQMHASTTNSCVVECTVIGTLLQQKSGQEIDTSEEFTFDEDVFEYLDINDEGEDDEDEDDDSGFQPSDGTGDVCDGGRPGRSSAMMGARKLSTSAAMRKQKRSAAARRPSRVSTTDAPSDVGQDPMQSTAAFAFEGSFNQLGLLHLSIAHVKYQPRPQAVGGGSEKVLRDADAVSFSAEINGGLTKQVSPTVSYNPGMLLRWDPKQPHFTFYSLKSRQVFLSLYRQVPSNSVATKGRSDLLTLGNVLLSDIADQSSRLPLTYAQPATSSFLKDDTKLKHTVKLTPCGEAVINASFTSLRDRQPCFGKLKVRSVCTAGLSLSADVQRLSCAMKVDGVFRGMSSESEVSDGTARWDEDRLCEVSCTDAVDLEVHVWKRTASSQSWLGCGVLPIAVMVQRQLEASQHSSVKHQDLFKGSIKQELWVPLEPQGFVQVEVIVAEGTKFASCEANENDGMAEAVQEKIRSTKQDKENVFPNTTSPEKPQAQSTDETDSPVMRRKSDPKWDDLLQLLKDKVELRKEVEYLHESLRSTKAQLAESEFSKAKLELENKQLKQDLRSTKKQTKTIAQKATQMELRELEMKMQGDEPGYTTA